MQTSGTGAGGKDHGTGGKFFVILLAADQFFPALVHNLLDGCIVKGDGVKLLGMFKHLIGKFSTVNGTHTGVVLNLICVDDLPAGRQLIQHQDIHICPCTVDSGGHAGRAGADDDQIVLCHFNRPPPFCLNPSAFPSQNGRKVQTP